MQSLEKKQNSMLVSLDSLPKDILDKLKDYKLTQEERREDSEVEDCFRSKSCDLPSQPKSRDLPGTPMSLSDSPSTPRLKFSDELIFRYPPSLQDFSSDKHETNSLRRYSDRGSSSPYSEHDHCHLFGEHSDWMMAERLKPRSPPVSPDTSSRSSACSFLADSQRTSVLNRSPESCFVRPPPSPRLENYRPSPRSDRTPQKRCLSPKNRFEQQEFLERTPVKQSLILPEPLIPGRSISGSGHKIESNSDQLSPSFYAREIVNRSSPVKRIPDFPGDYVEERRSVRKQLVFEGNQRRSDDIYRRREQFSPRTSSCQRFDYEDDGDLAERLRDPESSALLSQLLGQLSKRKRKTSERSECECDCDERSTKKRRSEIKRQMNLNYLKQLENDVTVLNQQLRRSEIETRPENCSCAIMERQFLQMAENAYKNVRRQDASADGFAQFRKELTETNQILKDSLTVLNNMKEFCEHKTTLGMT